jgi:hypothetical protein
MRRLPCDRTVGAAARGALSSMSSWGRTTQDLTVRAEVRAEQIVEGCPARARRAGRVLRGARREGTGAGSASGGFGVVNRRHHSGGCAFAVAVAGSSRRGVRRRGEATTPTGRTHRASSFLGSREVTRVEAERSRRATPAAAGPGPTRPGRRTDDQTSATCASNLLLPTCAERVRRRRVSPIAGPARRGSILPAASAWPGVMPSIGADAILKGQGSWRRPPGMERAPAVRRRPANPNQGLGNPTRARDPNRRGASSRRPRSPATSRKRAADLSSRSAPGGGADTPRLCHASEQPAAFRQSSFTERS